MPARREPARTVWMGERGSRYLGDAESLWVLVLTVLATLIATYDLFLLLAVAR